MMITLCGSAKFEKQFHEWNEKLTLSGHIVYDLAIYPSVKNNNKDWYDEPTKITLDLAHLCKIQNSDAIVVLNVNSYTGFSTKREIQWARMQHKKIYWLEDPEINDELASVLL